MKKELLIIGILLLVTLFSGCSTADHYYKEGKKSFESDDYEKAAQSFQKAIESNSNRADYYVDYGMALVALGQYDEAMKQFDHAYTDKDMSIVKENNKLALRGKGIAYYHMQKYKKAISVLKKAEKLDALPKLNVDILYYIGSAYRAIGSYQKAADIYTSILTEDKKNSLAYAERALCYRSLNRNEQGLEDYDRAIALEPDCFNYYFGKYNLLLDNGDTAGAKKLLTQAAKITATTEEDKYNLAKLHYYQGDEAAALKELEASYTKGYSEAYYYVGEIYRSNQDYSKAISYYKSYIKTVKVTSAEVYNQLAVCLIKTGEYKKAVKYLQTGIAFGDTGAIQILKKNEITVYESMGDFAAAKKKLKEYLRNYPEDNNASREAEFVKTRLIQKKES